MKDKTIIELLGGMQKNIDALAEFAKSKMDDKTRADEMAIFNNPKTTLTEVMELLPLYEEAIEALDLLVKCKDHKEICQGECNFYKNNKPLAWSKAKAAIATIKGESQ